MNTEVIIKLFLQLPFSKIEHISQFSYSQTAHVAQNSLYTLHLSLFLQNDMCYVCRYSPIYNTIWQDYSFIYVNKIYMYIHTVYIQLIICSYVWRIFFTSYWYLGQECAEYYYYLYTLYSSSRHNLIQVQQYSNFCL